jgi:hypothetical protein
MNRFPVEEVRKLPYVDQMPTDDRPILLRPFYDHERKEWISYVPVGDGKLVRLAGGEVIVGSYFARAPADVLADLEFPAGTLIAQCASFTGVIGALASLENDFFDLACILRRYELIATQSRADSTSASLLLSSELAYLIITVRSLYDILQKLSKNLARCVVAPDGSGKRVIHDLPESFAAMVLKGDQPLAAQVLEENHRLPAPIANFYAGEALRFKHLRDLRDGLEHHGESLPTIFCIESGPAVRYDESPWKEFAPWEPRHIRLDRFASLRGLFAKVVGDAIELPTRFLRAFTSVIAVQPPLSRATQLYIRHPFGSYLVSLPQVQEGPWEWEEGTSS